jgi:peptide/nickel transport system substrate-binding protein
MKRLFIIALSIGVSTVMALPVRSSSDKPKRGGTLTMAIRKDLRVMNPLVRTSSTDRSIRDLMFESLLTLDANGTVRPNLAESWKISKDGKLYTFELRKGVKFHNGQEMTAQDIKFAIDYTLNPRNGAYGISLLRSVKRAEASEKYRLRIHLKEANPAFLSFISTIKAFSAIPKESVPDGVKKISTFPPGTGPFKFVEWKPKRRIVMERFNEYWGHKPYIDKLVLRPIKHATVRFTALRAGDIDIVERTSYEWVKQVQQGKIKGIGIAKSPGGKFRGITFNVADPPFDNKKLRRAVGYAINKEEILSAAFFGFGVVDNQKYPKGHNWHFDGLPWPEYNPARAKSLLKESSYKGEAIELITAPGEVQETMATVVQAQLKRVGMNIRLELMDVGAYNQRERKGQFAFRFRGGDSDADPWTTYSRHLLCEPDLKRRIANVSGYCDKQVVKWLKMAETELDGKRRKELFRQIITKMAEDLPQIYFGFIPRFYTFRDYVKGFSTGADARFRWADGGVTHTWLDK